jgi:hypothetical protein
MALQTILLIIEWLRNLLLIMALFYGIKTIKALFKADSKDNIIGMKRIVFTLIAAGLAFLLLAFIIENFHGAIDENFTLIGVVFFSTAYVLLLLAFAYFWHDSSRFHRLHISEPVFFFGVFAGVMLWMYYLFRVTVQANAADLSLLNKIIFFIHPLVVAIIFLLTLIIHPAHKAKVIRTPLWYISSGIFLYFIGYNIMAYSFIRPVAKLTPLLYTVLLFLSAFYFTLGFFVANRKFSAPEEKLTRPDKEKKIKTS